MITEKRCTQCNTLNGGERIYCINCGAFLGASYAGAARRVTIWGTAGKTAQPAGERGPVKAPGTASGKKVAVCPMCGYRTPAENGMLPPFCTACNYFFQAGLDVLSEDGESRPPVRNGQNTEKTAQKTEKENAHAEKGPLKKAAPDIAKMRLLSVSGSRMPVSVKEGGNVLGAGGTALSDLHTDQQVSVWHSPSGWYFMVLKGTPVYNGDFVNQGIQKKLFDGDLFLIGNEYFRVEIT